MPVESPFVYIAASVLLPRLKPENGIAEMYFIARLQRSSVSATMNRLTQAVANNPETAVCIASVRAIVENAIFAGFVRVENVGVLARDASIYLAIFAERQIISSRRS